MQPFWRAMFNAFFDETTLGDINRPEDLGQDPPGAPRVPQVVTQAVTVRATRAAAAALTLRGYGRGGVGNVSALKRESP